MYPKTIKSLLAIPLAVLLLLAAPTAVQAQFSYIINADNTVTITGLTAGSGGAVTIPATTNGLRVTAYARITQEQAAPAWRQWLSRIFQPALPYPFWKSAIPLTAACALLTVTLYVRTPDAATVPQPQLHADKVDIEQVEQALEDFDILTPPAQAPAGSM